MLAAEQSSSPIAALAMNGGPAEGFHKGRTESIEIPQSKPVLKDDESIASGSTDSQSQMKNRLSVDMSKEQVEDLVRKLTIDEMKTKWFDEIFEKVKSERKLIVVDAFLPLCNRN
jgi:antitoxin component YwqK of YwqJK toxin-antitoxin module